MDRIQQALDKFDRADFVPDSVKNEANIDAPLPIGFDQTISQPSTVMMMLEWLEARPGHKVLDVGSGSGWTTALLSDIVGPKGQVYAVERIPQLVEFGRGNAERYNLKNVSFHQAGNQYGLPERAPFDRILVSAAANKLPAELLDQIKPGGKLVIPVRYNILEITKLSLDKNNITRHHGFAFVPLI